MVNERTPLRKGASPPPYVFMTNPNRVYRKQVRQFQCCICTAVLATFLCALTITIMYSVNNDVIDNTIVVPVDNTSLLTLLSTSFPLPDSRLPPLNMASVSVEDLTSAIAEGKASLEARDKLESMNPGISSSSPSYRHQQSVKTSARATNLARSAYVMDVATKVIVKKQKASGKKLEPFGRGPILNTDWLPKEECGSGPAPACIPSAYRSVDGSCNNPYKTNEWGVAMRPFRRQLPADYADGVSSPRAATDGSILPPARDVSTTVHRPTYRDDPKFSVMLAVWGQFLDHDITATALTTGAGGKALSCCGTSAVHPECYPVTLSESDAYYKQFGVTCMEFIRSAPAPTCALGPREQMNQVSSYIDGSVVYGNTPELSKALRTFQGGKLKMSISPDGRELLPISTNPKDGCNREEENAKGRYCFMAGDVRANENLHLTSLHLLMARQHNSLAQKLGALNPDWSDEQIYQETRKIVSAQMQHITYNEFLPVILGPDLMDKLELNPQESGFYNGYNASIDPTVSNSFATSSFRFAHTLLPGLMKVLASDTSSEEFIELHKMLFNPYSLYEPGYLDMALRGAINTKVERADTYFNKEVTQRLFERSDEKMKPEAPKYGLDLVSLNVQRGRDHGLPSYPVWRQYCGLSKPETFDDLVGYVDKESLDKMKAIYKSVDDVDMYTGALSEIPIEGGMLGPTVTCLISDQFKRLKDGDSFWYETPLQPQGFTLGQLNEIRKTSLAKVICDTSDAVTTAQPKVMESVRVGNERMSCSELPEMDLTKWMSASRTSSETSTGYTKIGVTITGGNIATNNGDPLWYGALPLAIPLPLLESITPDSLLGPVLYGHGVQWTGSITDTNGEIEIKGSFSLPKYVHEVPGVTNFSISWVNGEFTLKSKLSWNSSDINSIVLGGSYSSSVFLSEDKDNTLLSSNEGFIIVHTDDTTPTVIGNEKLPIILHGVYSTDKKIFYWTGDLTLTLPSSIKSVPNDIETLSASLPIEAEDEVSSSGSFSVIEGNIKTTDSDGSSSVLWSGLLPAKIPLPEFYNVVSTTDDGEKSPVFGNGIVWSASTSEPMIKGDFSFPQFYNGLSNFSIKWTQGVFEFYVLPLWNITLNEILTPGVKYTSKIILHEDKPLMESVNSLLNGKYKSGALEQFVVGSEEVIDGAVPVPVVLCGTYSPDRTSFFWSGNVILTVRKSKSKIEQQIAKLKSSELDFGDWSANRFGGKVDTGYLTGGLNGAKAKPIWTGNIPVSIPIPEFYSPISFLYTPGITWSGSLLGSTLQGTYTIDQIMWNSLIPTVQTWSGEFSVQINPLWNTTLDSLFIPGAKYYSKVSFQGVNDITYAPMSFIDIPGQSSNLYAPIILQGTYSLDGKTFLWSGNFITAFGNGVSLLYTAPSPQSKQLPIKNLGKAEKNSSVSLTISSGSVFVSPTGEAQKKVWSGSFPATIPLDALNPTEDKTTTNIMWSGKVTKDNLQGVFSVPTYVKDSDKVQWWSGNFSVKYTSKYNATLEKLISSGKKYNFKVIFRHIDTSFFTPEEKQSKIQSIVSLAMEAQDVLDDATTGKLVLVGDFYSKPFYCYISPFCSNKNEFYWSGDAFIALNSKNVIQLTIDNDIVDFIPQYSTQFGGQVTSGSLQAGLESSGPSVWWSGVLPMTIPVSAFYSPGLTPDSGAIISTGITWSGSSFGSTVAGTFSFPQYVWNGISKSIQWWNGQFNVQVVPIWNVTLDGLISPGVKYYSSIYFQGMKVPVDSETIIKGDPFGDDGVSPVISAPIILQGTYTPDRTAFIWSGDFIIAFKNSPAVFGTMKNTPKQLGNLKKTVDSLKDPTKPSKPEKLSVSFTLSSGNVFAAKENETSINIWSGKVPVQIDVDRISKPGGYSVSADVTWKLDQLVPSLNGQFTIPTYIQNDSLVITEMWSGNFSLNTVTKYGATFEDALGLGKTYNCRIFFKVQTKSVNPSSDSYSAPLQFVSAISDDVGQPCNLVLLGSFVSPPIYCNLLPFLCTERNLFEWSGQGFLSFELPKSPTVNMSNKLQQSGNLNKNLTDESGLRKEIFATVLSGHLVGSLESEYPRMLWSGTLPAAIPLPVFWTTEAVDVSDELPVYGHGVIWSGTQMGTFFEGYFSLPQYAWNGIASSVQWWNGRFSFLLEPSLNSTLDGLVLPGVKYNSRIVFQGSKEKKLLTSPSQDEINSALQAPIILQGTYSPDGKIFYWTGKVIIAFHTVPNPFYPMQYASSNLESIQEDVEIDDVAKIKKSVGVIVTSVNISGMTGESTALSMPVVIPLVNLSNKTTGANIVKVNWTATSVTDSQVVGRFTLPTYIPTGENFTVEPLSASFSLNLITLFNTSLDLIEPGMTYSSIVIFQSTKKMSISGDSQSAIDEETATGNKSNTIMLIGSLSPDKMFFTWTGQAWINFPPPSVVEPNKLTFILGDKNLQAPGAAGTVKKSVGVVVTSGNISGTTDGSVTPWWSGSLPAVIPLANLSNKTTGSSVVMVDWVATSVTGSNIEGTFTFPTYIPAGENYTVEPLSGVFSLNLITLFNTSLDVIQPGVPYSSIVIFQSAKPAKDTAKLQLDAATTGTKSSSIIMLTGSLSPDKMFFTWTGQAWINFPPPPTVAEPNKLTFILGDKNLQAPGAAGTVKKSVGVVVTSGNISGTTNGSVTPWWSGSLPAVIPLANLSNKTTGSSVVMVDWVATSVTGSNIDGTFTFPTYIPAGENFTVEPLSGVFSLNLITLFNTSLDVIQPGVPYSSIVIFQSAKPAKDTAKLQLDAATTGSKSSSIIMLTGSLSPDKMFFTWTGQAWINFPPPPTVAEPNKLTFKLGDKNLQAPGAAGTVKKSVGVVVTSGNISGTTNGSVTPWWSGSLPAVIPLANLSNKTTGSSVVMVDWVATSVTGSNIEGTFTFPTYIPAGENFTVEPLSGVFSLNLITLFNTSLDVIQPGVPYSSIVIFQSAKPAKDTAKLQLDAATTGSKSSSIIMLTGSLSPDKMFFTWTGQAWINFPPPPTVAEPNKLTFKLGDKNLQAPGAAGTVKKSVGVVVTSGNISGTTNGSVTPWWSGSLPAVIPLANLSNKTTGSSVVMVDWVATSVTGSNIEGTFTFPTYFPAGENFTVEPLSGVFSLNLITLFNSSLDVIQPGVPYSSIVIFQSAKPAKDTAKLQLDAATTGTKSSSIIMLTGSLSPDKMFFTWTGQAWINFPPPPTVAEPNKLTFILGDKNLQTPGAAGTVKKSVGVVVTSGNISGTTNGSITPWWSGSLPAVIPLANLSNKTTGSSVVMVDWVATSVTGSNIEGTFTFPTYIPAGENFTVEPLSGVFSLNLITLFNTSLDVIQPGVPYSSIVIFQSAKPAKDTAKLQLDAATTGSKSSSIIMLTGSLSPDKMFFTWTGQAWINFPPPPPPTVAEPNKLTFKLGDKNLQAPGAAGTVKKSVGVVVTSGNISGTTNGSVTPWWSRSLPAVIPLANLSNKTTGSSVVMVDWVATSVTGSNIEGTFTFPTYIPAGENFTVEPLSGVFSLNLITLFNTSLDVIQPGVPYSSIVIFQSAKPAKDTSKLQLDAATTGTKSSSIIMLTGSLSPDKMFFTWTGQAWINFPPPSVVEPNKLTFKLGDKNLQAPGAAGTVKKSVGVVVTSGNISGTTNGSVTPWWSGSLPAVIPLANLSNKTTGSSVVMVDWVATSVTGSNIEGTFTFPTYIPAGENFTVEPLSGVFSLNLITLFNTSLDVIQPGVPYSSIVIFQSAKPAKDSAKLQLDAATTGTKSSSIIMLTGSLSPDKTFFTWTGQAWINFPAAVTDDTVATSSKQTFLSAPGKEVKKTVGLVVSAGNITGTINGNTTSWFTGSPPFLIPVYLLSSKGAESGMVEVEWSADIVGPKLTGNFSFPMSLPDDPNFTVEWVTGLFEFNVSPLWTTTLDVIQPGSKYSTFLLFKDKSKPLPKPTEDSLSTLIMDSDGNDGSITGTISLTGSYSPDGMYFNWTGEAWANFKTNSSYSTKTKIVKLSSDDSSESTECKFGAAAVAGRVIGNAFGGPQTYWSGVLPVAIPVPTFYPSYKVPHGVLWSGSGTDTFIKGTYYFPKPVSTDVVWLTGDFEFHLRPLWNCTLTELIQPGVKYYSKINFQDFSLVSANEKALWTGEDFNKAHNTSITLQGKFSPDKATFFWSGNFVLDVFTQSSQNEV